MSKFTHEVDSVAGYKYYHITPSHKSECTLYNESGGFGAKVRLECKKCGQVDWYFGDRDHVFKYNLLNTLAKGVASIKESRVEVPTEWRQELKEVKDNQTRLEEKLNEITANQAKFLEKQDLLISMLNQHVNDFKKEIISSEKRAFGIVHEAFHCVKELEDYARTVKQ